MLRSACITLLSYKAGPGGTIAGPAERGGRYVFERMIQMLVFSQSGAILFEFQKPLRYLVDYKDSRVFAAFVDGHCEMLGGYDNKEHAKFVLGRMAQAYDDGRSIFYMPDAVEVRGELMNRHCKPVRSTGAGKSHGGT